MGGCRGAGTEGSSRHGGHGDGVVVGREVRSVCSCRCYSDCARAGGLAIGPSREGVAFIGRGGQGSGGTLVVRASAGNITTH